MDGVREDKILKITLFNHLAASLSIQIVAVLTIVALFWFNFDKDFFLVLSIGFLINALPALYLHFEYWARNKGEEYEITDHGIILRKNGKETRYKNSEIEKIIIYLSPSLYKNSNLHFLAIESYHYAIIKLKTGEELILTCLLAPRVDKALKQMRGVVFEKKKRLFCTFSKW